MKLEFIEKPLTIQEKFRLVEIAATNNGKLKEYALVILDEALNPKMVYTNENYKWY